MADRSDRGALERQVSSLDAALCEVRSELAAVREQMDRQLAERAQLLEVVSHELRTPVTVISGYNRLLLADEAGALSSEQRAFLEESQKSCKRLDAFIGNLLDASRDAFSGPSPQLRDGSLEVAISSVLRFMAPLLEARALQVEVAVAPDAVRAQFDAGRIEQVLTNLLGNAVKYAKPGGRVEVATTRVERGGHECVEISVSDDGLGVAEEHRRRIFQPYVRVDRDHQAGGLGLGLAICQRIVEEHGGVIALTAAPWGGCRFAFTLLASDADEKEED